MEANNYYIKFADDYAQSWLNEDKYQICVWPYENAPVHFQNLAPEGEDADYVFYIPKALASDSGLYWIENLDGGHKPKVIDLPSGAQVRIVFH